MCHHSLFENKKYTCFLQPKKFICQKKFFHTTYLNYDTLHSQALTLLETIPQNSFLWKIMLNHKTMHWTQASLRTAHIGLQADSKVCWLFHCFLVMRTKLVQFLNIQYLILYMAIAINSPWYALKWLRHTLQYGHLVRQS